MKYNFDEIIERRGTNSYKWDLMNKIKVKNGQEHTFTFISPSHWSLA